MVIRVAVLGIALLLGACDPSEMLSGEYTLERNATGAGSGASIARYVHPVDPDLAPQEAARLLTEVDLVLPASATDVTVENVETEPEAGYVFTDPVIRYTVPLTDLAVATGDRRLLDEHERSAYGMEGCFVGSSLDIVGEDIPGCLWTGWDVTLGPPSDAGSTPTALPSPSTYVELAAEVDGDLVHLTVLITSRSGSRL